MIDPPDAPERGGIRERIAVNEDHIRRAAFGDVPALEIAYAVVYLLLCLCVTYSLAGKSFERHVVRGGE